MKDIVYKNAEGNSGGGGGSDSADLIVKGVQIIIGLVSSSITNKKKQRITREISYTNFKATKRTDREDARCKQ